MNIFSILLTQPLTNGLILFYKVLGQNMGFAILGFGLFLRFILNPLTKPYMASMKKMKAYEKELKALKERHQGDKQKTMTAQADFYKEKGINPGAGCLPYLLQIVVLIAFFNVFTRVLGASADATILNETLYAPLKFSQGEVLNTKFLYLNLTVPDAYQFPGFPIKIPGPLLILAAFLQFISAKMAAPYVALEKKVAKKTVDPTDDMQVAMQGSMVYMFPLMTLVFGLSFPSALALYWLLFSIFQAWQQYKSSGWGGMTPFISKLGLLKSTNGK
ncbi:membrane protein insertase YidC [Candidatus Woesebacteria bacterium]|nr:membrane protein insertase YidC [Candidatus Woesebacteria bacterium]